MHLSGSQRLFSAAKNVLVFLQASVINVEVTKTAADFLKILDRFLNNNLFYYNSNIWFDSYHMPSYSNFGFYFLFFFEFGFSDLT